MPAAHVIIRLAGEIVHPAVFLVVGRIVREDIVVAVLRVAVLGFDEPFVLVAGVVQHVVEIDGDVLLPGLIDQFLELGLGLGRRSVPAAVFRVDREIVRDVVGVVGLRFLHGAEPEARRAEGVDVVEMVDDALEVAPAVAVAVRERVDVDLVGQARFLGGTGEVRIVFAAYLAAFLDLAFVGVGELRTGLEDVARLGQLADVHVVGAGRKLDVVSAGNEGNLLPDLDGRSAEIGVPALVLAELELVGSRDAHVEGGVPVAARLHGDVLVPAASADGADDGPGAALAEFAPAGLAGIVVIVVFLFAGNDGKGQHCAQQHGGKTRKTVFHGHCVISQLAYNNTQNSGK